MQTVILWKNTQNGRVGFIGYDDEIAVFDSVQDAENLAREHPLLQAFPYQVVEVEM